MKDSDIFEATGAEILLKFGVNDTVLTAAYAIKGDLHVENHRS
jgi:hypothetical protein